MKRAILLIAIIALCVGQSFGPKIIKGPTPSGAAPGWSLIDIGFDHCLSMYDFDVLSTSNFASGDLIALLPDLTGRYDVSASDNARSYWTNNATILNGNGFGVFDGTDDVLTNLNSVQYVKPNWVVIVGNAVSNPGGLTAAFLDNVGAVPQVFYEYNEDGIMHMLAGFNRTADLGTTMHKWIIWDYYIEEANELANSYLKTNQVNIIKNDFGGANRIGVTIGANAAFTLYSKMQVAWIGIYTNGMTETVLSNLVWKLGDRFGITTYTRD